MPAFWPGNRPLAGFISKSGLASVLLAACTIASTDLGETLSDCGYRGPLDDPTAELFEHPVVREGGPFVGIATERYDRPSLQKEPGVHYQGYSLLNCKTGTISKIEADASIDRLSGKTMLERVADLRAEGRLTRTGQLERLSHERMWNLMEGKVDPQNGRARCACALLTP